MASEMAVWVTVSNAEVKSVEMVIAAFEGGRFFIKEIIFERACEVVVPALKPNWNSLVLNIRSRSDLISLSRIFEMGEQMEIGRKSDGSGPSGEGGRDFFKKNVFDRFNNGGK